MQKYLEKFKHVYYRCAKDTDVAGKLLPSVAAWWIGSKIKFGLDLLF